MSGHEGARLRSSGKQAREIRGGPLRAGEIRTRSGRPGTETGRTSRPCCSSPSTAKLTSTYPLLPIHRRSRGRSESWYRRPAVIHSMGEPFRAVSFPMRREWSGYPPHATGVARHIRCHGLARAPPIHPARTDTRSSGKRADRACSRLSGRAWRSVIPAPKEALTLGETPRAKNPAKQRHRHTRLRIALLQTTGALSPGRAARIVAVA